MSNPPGIASNILHITTDALTAEHIDSSLNAGVFLAWQDALYEGPIDSTINLTELSRKRAQYFADAGLVDRETISSRYRSRNKLLFTYEQFDEVVLWFDRDLNSQLQLVQLIGWFSQHTLDTTVLSVVSVERLSKMSSYSGLGMLNSGALQSLMAKRSEITIGQMELSEQTWRALGADNPNALLRLFRMNTSTMPFLKNALLRLLKQFPSQLNGLSQSELHIANVLLKQKLDANNLYLAMQSKEGIPFMNRAIFACCLQNMCQGEMPLVEQKTVVSDDTFEEESEEGFDDVVVEQKIFLQLTELGRQVLHNWVDWVQVNGIQRTVGGVTMSVGNLWRYDEAKRKLTKTYV